ncbi:formyltransferase family protein [Halomicrococcus gelatinilyticus]|uniref:formyltransferase family protein n=1 Tax=Halomicrococcus gelatinilyticus TaxID=1702103 RepID=UPI002E0FB402
MSRGRQAHQEETQAEPLRVGVLLPGETAPAWMQHAIERMVAETDVEITHVVVNEAGGPDDLSDFLAQLTVDEFREYLSSCRYRLQHYPLWAATGVLRQFGPTPEYQRPTSIENIDGVADADQYRCEPVPADGFGNHLPTEVAETVGPNTDVVVRLGFGVLKGEFLEMPTHGVLSFHRGDLESYRGQPGGLWEFLHDEPTAGVTLQRIDDDLDAGEVVVEDEVDISDATTWREVERRQIAVCEAMLAEGVGRLRDPDHEPTTPDSLGTLYTIPSGTDVLRYVGKTAVGHLRSLASGAGASDADPQANRPKWESGGDGENTADAGAPGDTSVAGRSQSSDFVKTRQ